MSTCTKINVSQSSNEGFVQLKQKVAKGHNYNISIINIVKSLIICILSYYYSYNSRLCRAKRTLMSNKELKERGK